MPITILLAVPDQPSIAGVAVLFNSMAVLARAPATEKGERRGWEISYTVDGVETLQRSSPHTPLIFLQPISLGKVYRLKLRSRNTAGLGAWSEVWEQTAAPIIGELGGCIALEGSLEFISNSCGIWGRGQVGVGEVRSVWAWLAGCGCGPKGVGVVRSVSVWSEVWDVARWVWVWVWPGVLGCGQECMCV